jgi:signal transduction histidine kinase
LPFKAEIRINIELIHVQTGGISFQPSELKLQPMIKMFIDSISARAKAKNIQINYTSDDSIVKTNEAMFFNVLKNLITNAIKFTKDEGTVTIHTGKTSVGFEISVIDTSSVFQNL